MSIQIALKIGAGSTSERIEIFSATVFHADGHPMTTGSVWGTVLQMSRRGRSGRVSTLKTPSKSLAHCCRRMRSIFPCSYSKDEDDVPVTIHLDHVLEFSVGDRGDSVGERCRKFQREVTFWIPTSNLFYDTSEFSVSSFCVVFIFSLKFISIFT